VKYEFIEANKAKFRAQDMCRMLGVSRSGYYDYLNRKTSKGTQHQEANKALSVKINSIYHEHKGRYGSPRIHATLKTQGEGCSLGRVKRIMRKEGLAAKTIPKRKAKKTQQEVTDTHNLLRDKEFKLTSINQVWVSDITYIPTQEGWLYLAGTMDMLSRRIVGYAMADHMRTDLIIDCLNMAITNRRPSTGIIHHSDRGSQYTSYRFQNKLTANGFQASFTGDGACLDNARIESFWATLKKELECLKIPFESREEARTTITEYINIYYNGKRIHSSIDYRTPLSFERYLATKNSQLLDKLAA